MSECDKALARLSQSHRAALVWFRRQRGKLIEWPEPLEDGTFLVNRPKGIHKPANWRYALSVRQTLEGPYPDTELAGMLDGSWVCNYFQEGKNPDLRDSYFTNKGLMACIEDHVPIGVLRQTKRKPKSVYNVLGLAFVQSWEAGYFRLQGVE